MPVSNFPSLTILLFYKRKSIRLFGQFRGLFKEISSKKWGFCVKKKGERKSPNDQCSKILLSSNMDTKNVTNKRKLGYTS